MSKKSKMKEREKASYIAPCEDVVVELPFMVKRVMRVRRPSNELCKQCMRYEYCNEYHFMIGENYKPACMNNYYDDSDITARYGYKVAEDPTVVSEGVCVINDVIYGDAEEIQQFREPMVEVLPLWYRDFWLHDDYMDIICIELATNRLCCLAGWNKSKIPMIEAAIRGTYNIKVAQSEVHKVGNVCYT